MPRNVIEMSVTCTAVLLLARRQLKINLKTLFYTDMYCTIVMYIFEKVNREMFFLSPFFIDFTISCSNVRTTNQTEA